MNTGRAASYRLLMNNARSPYLRFALCGFRNYRRLLSIIFSVFPYTNIAIVTHKQPSAERRPTHCPIAGNTGPFFIFVRCRSCASLFLFNSQLPYVFYSKCTQSGFLFLIRFKNSLPFVIRLSTSLCLILSIY